MPRVFTIGLLPAVFLLAASTARAMDDELRGWIFQLRQNDVARRFEAARELNKLGPKDAAHVPTLVDFLGDGDEYVRQIVAGALVRIGKPALPALEKALAARDGLTRRTACLTLGQFGPDARPVVPALIKVLKDKERDVRAFAALALVRIEPAHAETFPALQQALKDPDRGIKLAAVYAMEQLGTNREGVLPALVEALKDEEADVKIAATAVLARMGAEAKAAAPSLAVCLGDADATVRISAASALAAVDETRANDCVPVLAELLASKDANVRRGACYVLGQIGAPAKPALAELKKALADTDGAVRQAAEQAVRRVEGK